MGITVDKLSAALHDVGTGSKILYIKEDDDGNIVDFDTTYRGNRFTHSFVELGMNICGYKRYRGREVELAAKVHNFVLAKINASFGDIEFVRAKHKIVENLGQFVDRVIKNAPYETKQRFQNVTDSLHNPALFKPNPIVIPKKPSKAELQALKEQAEQDAILSSVPVHYRRLLIRQNLKPEGTREERAAILHIAKLERYLISAHADKIHAQVTGLADDLRKICREISQSITARMDEYDIDLMVREAIKRYKDNRGLGELLERERDKDNVKAVELAQARERNRTYLRTKYAETFMSNGMPPSALEEISSAITGSMNQRRIDLMVYQAINRWDAERSQRIRRADMLPVQLPDEVVVVVPRHPTSAPIQVPGRPRPDSRQSSPYASTVVSPSDSNRSTPRSVGSDSYSSDPDSVRSVTPPSMPRVKQRLQLLQQYYATLIERMLIADVDPERIAAGTMAITTKDTEATILARVEREIAHAHWTKSGQILHNPQKQRVAEKQTVANSEVFVTQQYF